MTNKTTVETQVQDWITENWGKDSYDPESEYHNCKALLEKLDAREKRSRGTRDTNEATC